MKKSNLNGGMKYEKRILIFCTARLLITVRNSIL